MPIKFLSCNLPRDHQPLRTSITKIRKHVCRCPSERRLTVKSRRGAIDASMGRPFCAAPRQHLLKPLLLALRRHPCTMPCTPQSRSGGRNMQIWPRTSLIHPASVDCCLRISCLRAWMSASNSSFAAFLTLICFTCDNTSRRAIRLIGFTSQLQVATRSAQSPRAQRLASY